MATPLPYTTMNNLSQVMFHLLENIIRPGIPSLRGYVFDSDSSYESSITNARKHAKSKNTSESHIPLFSYTRSPLRPHEAFSMRSISTTRDISIAGDNANDYKSVLGVIDINFMFIAHSMREIENFEINYWAQNSMSEVKEFLVDFEEVGEHLYQLNWGELDEIQTSATGEDSAKVIRGSLELYGTFFSFKKVTPKITSIPEKIWDWTGSEIFDSEIII